MDSNSAHRETTGKILRIGAAAATVGVVGAVHAAADHVPLGQIMAMRAVISGVLILAYGLLFHPVTHLRPRDWSPHLTRGVLACGAMLLSYIAFARLPVSLAQTLMFVAPMIVVPLGAYRLGEALSPRLLLGLACGGLGVVLILGVSSDLGHAALWGVICGLLAALTVAIIQIKLRAMMATETALSAALSFTLIVAVVSSLSVVLGDWVWPTGQILWVLLAAGVFGALNLVLLAESLSRAPASELAPLDYTALIWALLVDGLVFATWPGLMGLWGSVLVTAGAVVIILKPRPTAPRTLATPNQAVMPRVPELPLGSPLGQAKSAAHPEG